MVNYFDALLLVFVLAFLLGSIPFGLVISKLFYKTDIREHGSGNIGTTNAIRAMGKVGGFSVFLLDFGKGLASGFLGLWIGSIFYQFRSGADDSLYSYMAPLGFGPLGDASVLPVLLVGAFLSLACLGCTVGHIFSPWLKFKGGKGIAVAVGCVFVTFGIIGAVLELAIFIVLVLVTRYVSIGSIAAAIACPLFGLLFFWGNWFAVVCCLLIGSLVTWAHRENIKRLFNGTESRIGSKKLG